MSKVRKPRSDSKMYQLPKDVRDDVIDKLINHNMSYAKIVEWLDSKGYQISKSSLNKYAVSVIESAQRVAEELEKTSHIMGIVAKNPDADPTKATMAILKSGLLQKISSADDEFNDMSVEKASKLLIQLARVENNTQQMQFDRRKKIDLAFEGLETKMLEMIKNVPEHAEQLREIIIQARDKALEEEG